MQRSYVAGRCRRIKLRARRPIHPEEMRLHRRRRPSAPPDPDLVDLLVDGVGVLQARVRGAHAGTADLDLVPPAPAGFLDGCGATLIPVAGHRVDGVLETGWELGHVRFTRTGAHSSRRVFARVEVARQAILVPDRLQGVWRATTRDLGAGGALIADVPDLPLGARLDLCLDLADEHRLETRVRVIRARDTALRAVHFERLSDEQRRLLVEFVAIEHARRLGGR